MRFYRYVLIALLTMMFTACLFAAEEAPSLPSNDLVMNTDQEAVNTAMTSESNNKMNLNTATAKDLMKVKGMNAAKARAIVKYRKKHGNFNSVDDLARVKGFKKMKPDLIQEIKDQLNVD